jgi:hypothetical protein
MARPHSTGCRFVHSESRGGGPKLAVGEEGFHLPCQVAGGSVVPWWGMSSSLTADGVSARETLSPQ